MRSMYWSSDVCCADLGLHVDGVGKPFSGAAGEGRSVPAGGETPEVSCRAGYSAGFSTTRVLTATSSGIASVSAQSPPPTPKSRRFTVALPASTGAAPGVQEIGRAHVCTPVTNAHLVCRLLLENKHTMHKHNIKR